MDSPSKKPERCLTNHYSSYLLFDGPGKQCLNGLTIATCNPNVNVVSHSQESETEACITDKADDVERKLVVPDSMFCNCCQVSFADRREQLEHYKCDWHRYNLHRRLKDLSCVSEEEFEAMAGDVSSISGSDDEDDDNKGNEKLKADVPLAETPDLKEETAMGLVLAQRKFHKVFFKTKDGELISLYRCLLHDKKNPLYNPEELLSAVSKLQDRKKWAIFMVSAGHFAGAIFNGKEVIEHKTFHRYTVRAKRGTAQSTKDSQGGAPKSGGATLRRYNEAALVQEVQELLTNWADHIKTCDFVFVRIPVANRGMFYGGKNPPLKKDDPRIRVIPFATRRPTFSETKRVHQMLASVECYGLEKDVGDIIPLSPPRVYDQETGQLEVRKSSPTPKAGKAPSKKKTASQPEPDISKMRDTEILGHVDKEAAKEDSEEDEAVDMELVETIEEISFSDLKEFDCSVRKKPARKKKSAHAKKPVMQQELDYDEEMITWRNSIFTACKSGNNDILHKTLEEICKHGGDASQNGACSGVSGHSKLINSSPNQDVSGVNGQDTDASKTDVDGSNNSDKQHHLTTQCKNIGDENHVTNPEICGKQITSSADSGSSKTQENAMSATLSDNVSTAKPVSITSPLCLVTKILNSPLNDDDTTFLHVASKQGHPEVIAVLLEAGADPAVKDKSGKTPYNLAETEVRNTFRRFMAKFPDKYDYAKAQVPSPLTAEMEAEKKQKAAEKRKVKKKANQERSKEKKAAEAQARSEKQEKDRFLALSDREKRALAAERRILQKHSEEGSAVPVLSRCFQCGTDMTGKVPFEYSDYKFCTTKCLREHRSKPIS